jgi:hypothetical protein
MNFKTNWPIMKLPHFDIFVSSILLIVVTTALSQAQQPSPDSQPTQAPTPAAAAKESATTQLDTKQANNSVSTTPDPGPPTTRIIYPEQTKVSALTMGLVVIGSILAMMLCTFIYVFIDLKYCDKTPPADEEEPLQEVVEKV